MIFVEPGDPRDPQATALLQASHALMRRLFKPEENHFLSIDALCAPDVHFFVAREADALCGTAALKVMDGYGEVKSMFVADAARGRGVADALLRQVEDQARALGLPMMRLETADLLDAAIRLYARHGFDMCGPFGAYQPNRTSVFMEKSLA